MLLTYATFCVLIGASFGDPVVKTSLGVVEGHYQKSYNGRTYSAFEGIPFAKPPVGKLRFEEPLPAEPWNGVLKASTLYTCMQFNGELLGEEDCLYLNVYVPNENPTLQDNLDVIVFIHGGAFTTDSPASGGPKYFMDRDVIVTFNYRLNVFGFISTEDEVVPGNNGMKDQTLALKWVQKHIKNFGGNANSVTLTGTDSGSGSTHLHYLSKNSKGLFHRGISNSATSLMSYATQRNALERAKELSTLVGCDSHSNRAFIDCMKEKPASLLIENLIHLESPAKNFPVIIFGPVVEPKSANAFLEDYPFNLLESNEFHDLPWLTSLVGGEGILGLMLVKDDLDGADEFWNERAQFYLDCNYTVCEKDRELVAKSVREHYFGNNKISLDSAHEIINMFEDRFFGNGFEMSARIHAAKFKSPVYTYIYNYSASWASIFHQVALMLPEVYGVMHGEDNLLTYHNPIFDGLITLTKTDEAAKDLLLDIATSFAKNGVPSVKSIKWNPLTVSDDFSYLYIESPDKVEFVTQKEVAPLEFWNNLPMMENEKLNETCKENL